MTRAGWVYVLTNPAMPGRVKIGHTGDTPEARARKLSEKTAVPEPFVVAWAAAVTDHAALEKIVHDKLDACRPNANREFFRCSVDVARHAIEREAKTLLRPWWLSALLSIGRGRRRSWRRSSGDGLMIGAAVGAVLLLALLKPDAPHWLPYDLVHLLRLLEIR